jgi:RNA polymerase sigma factor (sigma-70 family)
VTADDRTIDALSDSELMKRLQMGDTQALGILYERYRGVVNAVVHRQASGLGEADSEDVCHEVFLTLMDIADRYRPGETLRGWLCGIAVRKARRMREGRWLRQGLLGRFFPSKQSQSVSPGLGDERVDFERILAQLSAPLREVVVLSLVEQLSAEEVASALNISVNTVWTRLHRARERIRALSREEDA